MCSDEGIIIRTFNKAETGPLSALTESEYTGREISDIAYLDWEYRRNPEGKALIHVAEAGERIVSQYVVLPRSFSVNGKIIPGSLSVNTLTHPSFRGRGLLKTLAEKTFHLCTENGIQFTIGFPNPVSHPLIRKHKLFETIGELPLLVMPLSPVSSLLKYFSGKRSKSGEEIVLDDCKNIFNEIPGTGYFNFETDEDRYKNLLREFNGAKPILKNRTFDFLKWRYSEIPIRRYSLLKFETGNELNALVVLRAKNIFGLRCGIVVDMISSGNERGLTVLFRTVKEIARKNSLDLVFTTVSPHAAEFRLLKNNGYRPVPGFLLPQKLAFIIRKHTNDCPAGIDDFKKWFLTFGDYDIF